MRDGANIRNAQQGGATTGKAHPFASLTSDAATPDPNGSRMPSRSYQMNMIKGAILAAGLLTSLPVLAQTAGNTPNTGPQGTGNFVAGQTERYGIPVTGRPEGTSHPASSNPDDKMDKTDTK
jgi:hypothetical protein